MIPILDISALLWFLICWIGYTRFADLRARDKLTLMSAMHGYRRQWMHQMMHRDVRIVDSNIVMILARSATFLASTTIFIVAGLIAVMGTMDTAIEVVGDLRYAIKSSREVWELKMLGLLLVFIYAFFKFTWSMRHFNYLSTIIGAAPMSHELPAWSDRFAERAAKVSSKASNTFNRGLRAYYFGLAFLSWFLHPLLFILATTLVVGVLYRREFNSGMLKELGDPDDFTSH
ncbi:MAG: DUF599 domain-containing protein [Candidatus Thiodiazotropha sp. (ex. Lucinisca nassula)]|nr:DUF599 domain-containing protein [Candidatus Thiodiazotropha sp. (ex. Lucinisca nassula)]MBW9268780.1 DUF599 domain-containing protein [Candidatus Thiodiazotropha sp. (ex. Lucinisca nassula)]